MKNRKLYIDKILNSKEMKIVVVPICLTHDEIQFIYSKLNNNHN